jgi:hypothetical protein
MQVGGVLNPGNNVFKKAIEVLLGQATLAQVREELCALLG